MDRNTRTDHGFRLESQIREAYGRVVYTQTCHEKMIQRLIRNNSVMKIIQIVLSTLTTGTFIVTIFTDERISSVVGVVLSIVLLMINSFNKSFKLSELTQKHQVAANQLWKIREEYVSLLTDFELLKPEEIMKKRDELQNRTASVNNEAPRTDAKCYRETQKALKIEEEQTFSEQEIDSMLPNSIRRNSRGITE